MRRLLFLSSFSLKIILLASLQSAAAQSLVFENTLVPEAPPGAKVMAAYMNIENSSKADIEIKQVTSPDFKTVEMHTIEMQDDVARMVPLETLKIEAKKTIRLKPGGLHLMLYNPKKSYQDGDKVVLILSQVDGTEHILEVPVKSDYEFE